MIIQKEKFNDSLTKGIELIDMKCDLCDSFYQTTKSRIKAAIRVNSKRDVCSTECLLRDRVSKGSDIVKCLTCEKNFSKLFSQIKKSPNHFCCSNCSAIYTNKNRKTGFRRSKAELFLETIIREEFPNLEVKTSVRDLIPDGLEVDILLPTLNIAIELNGPVHYFPIYGEVKFENIKSKDVLKQVYLQQAGFNLIVLNISELKYWKTAQPKIREMYEEVIKPLLK